MKKSIAFLSVFGLTVLLCACGKENTEVVTTTENKVVEESTVDESVVVDETVEEAVEETIVDETVVETTENTYDIVGSWIQTNSDTDSYMVLEFDADGMGRLLTEPEDIGVALNYEIDGTSIMTHLGAADDNTPMEYLPEEDEIHYRDIIFARDMNTTEAND